MLASSNTSRPALGNPSLQSQSRGLLARLLAAFALHRQRQHLATLDDAMLDDIGLTREAAEREARRPVWDAPGHWLR